MDSIVDRAGYYSQEERDSDLSGTTYSLIERVINNRTLFPNVTTNQRHNHFIQNKSSELD